MRRTLAAAVVTAMIMMPAGAMAQSAIDAELAPGGQLRFGLNGANSTIVTRIADGSVGGVAPELGRFIAPRLGASFVPVLYATSAAYTDSMEKLAEWDICVTGRNPRADAKFDYSPDVIAVEYVLLAAPGKTFADVREVDRAGVTIAVARNASADVFLSRSLKSAELLRTAGGVDNVVELLRDGKADLFATGTGIALDAAARLPGSKIVGVFHKVSFAVAIPKGRSTAAQGRLTALVNEAKAAGVVSRAIEQAGLKGVHVP
jgi:polar amino acid transport system substrate-binding protein